MRMSNHSAHYHHSIRYACPIFYLPVYACPIFLSWPTEQNLKWIPCALCLSSNDQSPQVNSWWEWCPRRIWSDQKSTRASFPFIQYACPIFLSSRHSGGQIHSVCMPHFSILAKFSDVVMPLGVQFAQGIHLIRPSSGPNEHREFTSAFVHLCSC